MLFIPLEKNIDWKKPPFITIFLIVINFIFYFGFQLSDDDNYAEAFNYYFSSGLIDIETLYYADYLKNKENKFSLVAKKEEKEALSSKEKESLFFKMRNDGEFLLQLESDKIIQKEDKNFEKWKPLSKIFYEKLNNTTSYAYGIKNYKVTLETIVSHMFLHANFEHLFWNMVFLFIFGFSVEAILGWKTYISTYLLAGIGSAVFDILLEPSNALPGIGASGAISGLTGMYTVLFGMRKIRFFYFVFVYFDTVKAPAIIILPLWLGYEFYNYFYIPSNINNLAHAGGLICGAIIAYASKKLHKEINIEYMDENNNKEAFNTLYSEAQKLISELKLDKAKIILLRLYKEQPDNIEMLLQLYSLAKFNPDSDDYHRWSKTIFEIKEESKYENEIVVETFNEYLITAKPSPKLNVSNMTKLVKRFLKFGYLQEAEKIVLILIKNKVKNIELMESLKILIDKYNVKDENKSLKYQNIYNKLNS